MKKFIKNNSNLLKKNDTNIYEFLNIIHDLSSTTIVQEMKNYNQHANTTCYKHCMQVAFYTYLICKKLNLDYVSATRGAMLHDLFLYDWHTHKKPNNKFSSFHAFSHPKIALKNALANFKLNDIEKDVILNHMWPVTISIPNYYETVVVTFADKYSALKETYLYFINKLHSNKMYRFAYIYLSLIFFRII